VRFAGSWLFDPSGLVFEEFRSNAAAWIAIIMKGLRWSIMSTLRRSKLPKPFFIAAILEAVVPSYWNSYLKQSKMKPTLDLLNMRPSKLVLDVGVHVGLLAVEAAEKLGPDGLIVAVELEPGNLLPLRICAKRISNMIWNGLTTFGLHTCSNSPRHSVTLGKRAKQEKNRNWTQSNWRARQWIRSLRSFRWFVLM
jgi:hypothetical protein